MKTQSMYGYQPIVGAVSKKGKISNDVTEILLWFKSSAWKEMITADKARTLSILNANYPKMKMTLFYFNPKKVDLIPISNINYSYQVGHELMTAYELVQAAKKLGFPGLDTRSAASFLREKSITIEVLSNPHPKYKFVGVTSSLVNV